MSYGVESFFHSLDGCVFIITNTGEIRYASTLSKLLLGYYDTSKINFFELIQRSNPDEIKRFQALENFQTGEFRFLIENRGKKLFDLTAYSFYNNEDEALYCISLHNENFIHQVRKDLYKKTESIEKLSKSNTIRQGNLHESVYEIVKECSIATSTARVNVWKIDRENNVLKCLGNYDAKKQEFDEGETLNTLEIPMYFDLFEKENIILISDAMNSEITKGFKESYLLPNNIHSLMDIPFRIEGQIEGVICFENVNRPRLWTIQEQKFGLIAAQLVSLAIESNYKIELQKKLENSLIEKEILIQETYHRVKNNLNIVSSLMNLQKDKIKDDYHVSIFNDMQNKILSIADLHELLYESQDYRVINIKGYILGILDHVQRSSLLKGMKIYLKTKIQDVVIDVKLAIPIGLIVNELVTNAYKHAFSDREEGEIQLVFEEKDSNYILKIKDNGIGFNPSKSKDSFGFSIVEGLVEQIDGKIQYGWKDGFSVEILITSNSMSYSIQ